MHHDITQQCELTNLFGRLDRRFFILNYFEIQTTFWWTWVKANIRLWLTSSRRPSSPPTWRCTLSMWTNFWRRPTQTQGSDSRRLRKKIYLCNLPIHSHLEGFLCIWLINNFAFKKHADDCQWFERGHQTLEMPIQSERLIPFAIFLI